jgi:large subunit ribosomal protein L35
VPPRELALWQQLPAVAAQANAKLRQSPARAKWAALRPGIPPRAAACQPKRLMAATIEPKKTGLRTLLEREGLGGRLCHVVLCFFVHAAKREMPKLKTRKAAAKRFKATGTGKFLRRRAFRSHLLDHKSPKRKRYLGTMALVDERDADNVSAMLPYA